MHSMQRRTKNAGCCAPAGVRVVTSRRDRLGGAQHRRRHGVERGQMALDLRLKRAGAGQR